jgi:methyltransferase (TIGR00027 family)
VTGEAPPPADAAEQHPLPDALPADVSDTARWAAAYRAQESARPDAVFNDPFAARLAGERGRAIAAAAPHKAHRGWSVVARTKVIDDLVVRAVAEGCDRVINLAAGLDTRPYRLPLPPSLTWIEADLPAILDEKERLLAGETPGCRLVREKVDLADAAARDAFLSRAVEPALRVLVLTEGLLGYLDRRVVRSLARDLAERPPVRWWILDLYSPRLVASLAREKQFARAPIRFGPSDGVAFFEKLGWRARDVRSLFRAGTELGRVPWYLRPFALFPDPNPRKPGRARWAGVVRLERPRTTPRG